MKKLTFKILITLVSIVTFQYQTLNTSIAQNLQAYFSYALFLSPETGPYVETYLSINGNSIVYKKNEAGKLQGAVEVIMIFKEGDTIRYVDKYKLLSPEIDNTDSIKTNFIDQQRISLPNGVYDFDIRIADANMRIANANIRIDTNDTNRGKAGKAFNHREIIIMDFSDHLISISDIELIESYKKSTEQNVLTKSGHTLIPYITNFYPQTINKLIFYAEIYNSSKALDVDEKYLVNYFIESSETDIPLNKYKRFVKQTAKNVNVVFSEFSIEDLPSGNYNLVIEVRNRENVLLTNKKLFFQRSNPGVQLDIEDFSTLSVANSFTNKITHKDTLAEYIRSLAPISSRTENIFADNQLQTSDLEQMQKFFLYFWNKRNNLSPETAWLAYLKEVNKVDREYGTRIYKGYETDRGRIYLHYGLPNSITKVDHEPNSYPYEIWHYYKTDKKSNVKFVFIDTDLAINDYTLIHSNAIGEIYDPSWHYQTQKRNTPFDNIDILQGPEHYGGRALDYYKNPR